MLLAPCHDHSSIDVRSSIKDRICQLSEALSTRVRSIARNAILATVVIVAVAVIVVIIIVGVTLKICGSEKHTAEHRPWQSEAAGSRLRVLGPEVPDAREEKEVKEEELEKAGRNPLDEEEGLIIVFARQPIDERIIKENGGSRGGAGRCQLPDGHGEEQVHTGRPCQQEDYSAGS